MFFKGRLATMGRRSKYSSEFKAKVALEAIKEKETLAALAKRFDVSPSKITEWKDEFFILYPNFRQCLTFI
jgi:transposase-like protein